MKLSALLLSLLLASAAHAEDVEFYRQKLAIARAKLALETSPAASDDATGVHGGIAPLGSDEIVTPLVPVPKLVTPPPRAPRQRYEMREVTRYREVRVKHCSNGRCWYTMEQRPYTVQERVLVRQESTNVGQISNTADTYATPLDAATRILEYLRPTSPKTLLDLGSGDGRMVVEWSRWTGYPAIGIEQDPYRVRQSRNFAKLKGVEQQAKFVQGDYTQMDWPRADIVYVYQFPDDLAAVRDKLTQYDHIVSYMHEIPGLQMTSHNGGEFYSWRKPVVRAQPVARAKPIGVWYNGRLYTKPVCNRKGCSMCGYLRMELAKQGLY